MQPKDFQAVVERIREVYGEDDYSIMYLVYQFVNRLGLRWAQFMKLLPDEGYTKQYLEIARHFCGNRDEVIAELGEHVPSDRVYSWCTEDLIPASARKRFWKAEEDLIDGKLSMEDILTPEEMRQYEKNKAEDLKRVKEFWLNTGHVLSQPAKVPTIVQIDHNTPRRTHQRGAATRSSAKSGDSNSGDSDPDPEPHRRSILPPKQFNQFFFLAMAAGGAA